MARYKNYHLKQLYRYHTVPLLLTEEISAALGSTQLGHAGFEFSFP